MSDKPPLVDIASGRLRGLRHDGVREFRGVPFAAPPLAEWRFRAPQPAPCWSGVRDADRFAAATWQQPNPFMGTEQISDDCLYLNIWAPEGEGPFPVMVWIHGGSYTSGSPSQALYQGRRLALQQQVVVVNISYRLGAWGYGRFADLLPGLECDSNLGLRDQIAALAWIQENIAAFAGDPRQVTLFGESAGGFSVATLLAAPSARQLFQRAIVQSGAADFVLAPDQANLVAERLLAALPAGGATVDGLLSIAARDFVAAQQVSARQLVQRGLRATTPQFGMVYMPVLDGDVLPLLPVQALAMGAARDKALLASVCDDEWHLFQYAPPFNGGVPLSRFLAMDEAEILRRMERLLPGRGEAALACYKRVSTIHPARGAMDMVSALETDRTFRVPTVRLLDAQVSAGGDAWGCHFSHQVEAFGVPLGACHVLDVPLVFGLADTPAGRIFSGGGAVAEQLSAQVMAAWGQFAHHGRVNWPSWADQRRAHTFGPGAVAAPLLDDEREAFWCDCIPQFRAADEPTCQ